MKAEEIREQIEVLSGAKDTQAAFKQNGSRGAMQYVLFAALMAIARTLIEMLRIMETKENQYDSRS